VPIVSLVNLKSPWCDVDILSMLQENGFCEKSHSSRLIREVSHELIPLMTRPVLCPLLLLAYVQ
jgi:hypothetical protein